MKFTEWQIDKIRRGLLSYRIYRARNGRQPPWKDVVHQILMSEVTSHAYPEDGREPDFKPEALRRFANMESLLQPDKLEDLQKFLIRNGFLTEDELKDDLTDLREMLNVYDCLANHTVETGKYLSLLSGRYSAVREIDDVSEKVELDAQVDNSGTFLRLSEHFERIEIESERSVWPDNRKGTRRGYGFLSTRLNLLYIFLRGASPQDRINYFQIGEKREYGEIKDIHLMRSGGALSAETSFRVIENNEGWASHNSFYICDLYRFFLVDSYFRKEPRAPLKMPIAGCNDAESTDARRDGAA